MKVLLIGMPDVVAMGKILPKKNAYPNLAVISLASNLDCDVKVLNLVYKRKGIRKTILSYLRGFKPGIVGLSSMSFQFHTLKRIAAIIKEYDDNIKIAIGGYHASLMYDHILNGNIDFIVRKEGEITFNELVQAVKEGEGYDNILGLSYRKGDKFVHNKDRPLTDLNNIRLPDRSLDVMNPGYNTVVETSRGCTFGCKFCSISKMLGRSYREYAIDRVIQDLKNVKRAGYRSVKFSDDNMTLNVERLERLLDRIIEEGLNDIEYMVELSSEGVSSSERIARKLKKAGFGVVFIGVENFSMDNLTFLNKKQSLEKSFKAIKYINDNKIISAIGLIVGNPDDTKESIKRAFSIVKKCNVDFAHVQFLQPYPATGIRDELMKMGLIVNKNDFSKYCGDCNIRTKHLSCKELRTLVKWERLKLFFGMLFNVKNKLLKRYGIFYYVLVLYMIYAYVTGIYYKTDVRF